MTEPHAAAEAARMPPRTCGLSWRRCTAHWPDAKTELVYEDPYTLLVSVVLSAQTTDAAVNRATGPLFKAAPTPAAMVALGEDGLGALHQVDRAMAGEGPRRHWPVQAADGAARRGSAA